MTRTILGFIILLIIPASVFAAECVHPDQMKILQRVDRWHIVLYLDRDETELAALLDAWAGQRDWQRLQALSFVLDRCGLVALSQNAWNLAWESYLMRGGIPAYAQSPQLPWWVFWDALFLNDQLTPQEAWRLFQRGSLWTPNLWDRTVRTRVLAEWFRKLHAFNLIQALRDREKQLADHNREFRVDPLTWQVWRHALSRMRPWLLIGLIFWIGLMLGFPALRRMRAKLAGIGLVWGLCTLVAAAYPAWLDSAWNTWLDLRDNLLATGFITTDVPEPWLALFEDRYPLEELPRSLRKRVQRWRDAFYASFEKASLRTGQGLTFRDWIRRVETHSVYPFPVDTRERQELLFPKLGFRSIPLLPAPWSVLHALSQQARWRYTLHRGFTDLARDLERYKFLAVLALLIGVILARAVTPLDWLVPGMSRLRSGALIQGGLLHVTGWFSLIAVLHMLPMDPRTLWGDLLDPHWIAFIEALGRRMLILWGGLYTLVWGVALMAWTLHFMAYFIDRTRTPT